MKKQTVLVMLFWSIVITLATPLLTSAVVNHTDNWLQLRFGYPFPFIEQTVTVQEPEPPSHYLAALHPREHPSRLLLGQFFFSVTCTFLILASLSGCFLELRRLTRK